MDSELVYSRKERVSVFISTLFGYGLDFYNILIISFLMSAIQKSLGITLTQAGTITSVTLIGSVFGGVFFGWIGDRIGRKTSLLLTLGLFSFGALLSAFSWNFASLLFFRLVTGVGLGGEWGAGVVLFNEVWDRNRRGFGSALIQAASTAGIGAASVISVWALGSFSPDWGWRVALLTGASPIILMIYVRFWMPESRLWLEYERLRKAGQLPVEKASAKAPIIEIFRGTSLIYTLIGFTMVSGYMFAFYSVTVFMPGFMTELGAPPAVIRSVSLIFAGVMACAYIIFGWFSDGLGRKVSVAIPTLICIVGYGGIYLSAGSQYTGSLAWLLLMWYVVWGVGQISAGMFGPWFSELYPVEVRSTAVSTIYVVGRGVGSLAPLLVPIIVATLQTHLINGMMVGAMAAVICLIAALILPETAGRRFSVIETKQPTPGVASSFPTSMPGQVQS
ncbi:MAG TPA: MFS transporter [Bradyrhizobium sp.]|nr:MFS transporter [Bradyrhizobium sp.]